MSESPVRVIVVDDRALLREATTSLLGAQDGIEVVTAVASTDQVLELDGSAEADVVLVSLTRPAADPASATAALRAHDPHLHVVVLLGEADPATAHLAVTEGADACLLASISANELVAAIQGVVVGSSTFSHELFPLVPHRAPGSDLTARERDVLALVADGMSNKAIARALHLTVNTVRMYVSTILTKLGVTNRTEAAAFAIQTRIVRPGADRAGCSLR